MTLPSRLESMVQNPNLGGRPERTSQERMDQQEELSVSNEEAFDRREKLHLGSNFHVTGDYSGLSSTRRRITG